MYKISELIGKQAITLLDADCCGTVAAAYFDKKLTKLKYFLLLSDEDEGRFFVDYKNLSSLASDAVVIKSKKSLTDSPCTDIVPSPINLPAFNQDGKSLGQVKDIVVNDDDVVTFVTSFSDIEAGTLLSRSDSIVVFNDTGSVLKIKNPPVKNTKKTKNSTKNTLSLDNVSKNASFNDFKLPSDDFNKIKTPLKISSDGILNADISLSKYYFLLGKRLQRTIYSQKGNLIAKEDELITELTIKKAKAGGRLVAIALHSI